MARLNLQPPFVFVHTVDLPWTLTTVIIPGAAVRNRGDDLLQKALALFDTLAADKVGA